MPDLLLEVRDQWGQPLVAELLRLSSPSGAAGVGVPNGLSTIELSTDSTGQLQVALTANGFGGDHEILIEALSSSLQRRVAMSNLGPAGLPQTLPVPGPGPWALLLLALLTMVIVHRRL